MFTQLSLFDSLHGAPAADTAAYVRVSGSRRSVVRESQPAASPAVRRSDADRRADEIRPMGELAQLVLARYDLLAQRREEMQRRRREQPRRSIRVLGPAVSA